ncbi:MAG TPA: LPXTG cell wall anchor domain-containing protein [Candidatus Saccharimonadales bacterium]
MALGFYKFSFSCSIPKRKTVIKRSLATVAFALLLALVGTPAMAQPELPVVPGPEAKTTEKCVADVDTKKVGTLEAVSQTAWKVTITGDKPLCTPVLAQVANWRFDNPKQGKWPQTLVETGELVTIEKPGTYTVAASAREDRFCGQTDGYAEQGIDKESGKPKAPDVPKTLVSATDSGQPNFLHYFFKGKPAWTVDDPAKCKCDPLKPEINVTVKGCVGDKDGTVTVTVKNPNEGRAKYTVKLGGLEPKEQVIEGGKSADFVFSGLSAGEYQLNVTDPKHELEVKQKVTLVKCPPATTTTVPTTTTTTTVTTTTTTADIVPAANTDTDGGQLADTGANVGWLVAGGVLLLVVGALVLWLSRRRRA